MTPDKRGIKGAVMAAIALSGLTAASMASAHHSASMYDLTKLVELEGTLVELRVINPHSQFKVKVANSDGTAVIYTAEGDGVTPLKNKGLNFNDYKSGMKVKIAGRPSRENPHNLLLTNLMGPSGHEMVLAPTAGANSKPLWTQATAGGSRGKDPDGVADPEAARLGIFRIWNPVFTENEAERESITHGRFVQNPPKLNDQGQALFQKQVALRAKLEASGQLPNCAKVGMPLVASPFLTTISFVRKGAILEQRSELGDLKLRKIYMQPQAKTPTFDPATGYSVGHWEGSTLVVRTTGVKWGGVASVLPISDKLVFTERYTPSADGAHLDYQIVREDPVYLKEAQVAKGYWVWRPNSRLEPYVCADGDKRQASLG